MRRPAAFRSLALGALSALGVLSAWPATAHGQRIQTEKIRGGVHVLFGRGGNIGICAGEDGVFLIDSQFDQVADRVRAAVGEISPEPIRFLINTHWHGDHTGGNEKFAKTGAVVIAHRNVRIRMSAPQFMESIGRGRPASPPGALPVVTFTQESTLHLNGETVRIFHVPSAHTDGDAIVHFQKSNVIHMGDTFFHGNYPFIDYSSGGSIHGVIDAANRVIEMADGDTVIIPGHGRLANRADLVTYRDMLITVRDRLSKLMKEGKTADEIVAARPNADFDESWGKGFMDPERFLRVVLEGMKRWADRESTPAGDR